MDFIYGQRSEQRDHEKCAAMRNILLLTYKGTDPGDELEPKRGDGLFCQTRMILKSDSPLPYKIVLSASMKTL